MPPLCVKRKQIYMLISVSILLLVSKRLFMSHNTTAYLQWTPNDDKTPCKHFSYLENVHNCIYVYEYGKGDNGMYLFEY